MSEAAEETAGKEVDVEALQAQLDELAKSNEALKAKNDELLGETKKAKALRREAEEKARLEAEEKARAAGDHEQLYKSSEEARKQLQEQFEGLRNKIAREKRENTAIKLASKMADGANAELLSKFIIDRLKFVDDEIKVTDSDGNLTVSSLDDLANEFKNDERYKALIKGNQSSGGGATGGQKGGGAAKTMTRADFDSADHATRAKFMAEGGKLIDT